MLDEGRTGLLCPIGDSAALAGCLERLVQDADLRRAMGSAAAEDARGRWHPDAIARQTLAVYHQVHEQWGAGPGSA